MFALPVWSLSLSTAATQLLRPLLLYALFLVVPAYSPVFKSASAPRQVRLFGELFSEANGLLTLTFKLKRNELIKRFQEVSLSTVFTHRWKKLLLCY